MNSRDLFNLLGSVRKVQRKLELLKPVADQACDDVQAMAVLAEKREKAGAFSPTHRHHKGGVYQVIGYGRLADDPAAAQIVVYRDAKGVVWARRADNFNEVLEGDVRRFSPIEGDVVKEAT